MAKLVIATPQELAASEAAYNASVLGQKAAALNTIDTAKNMGVVSPEQAQALNNAAQTGTMSLSELQGYANQAKQTIDAIQNNVASQTLNTTAQTSNTNQQPWWIGYNDAQDAMDAGVTQPIGTTITPSNTSISSLTNVGTGTAGTGTAGTGTAGTGTAGTGTAGTGTAGTGTAGTGTAGTGTAGTGTAGTTPTGLTLSDLQKQGYLTNTQLTDALKSIPQGLSLADLQKQGYVTGTQLSEALKNQQDALTKNYSTTLSEQSNKLLSDWGTQANQLKSDILSGVDTKNQQFGQEATKGFMNAFKNFQIPTDQQTGVNLGNYNANRNAAADQWWSQYVTGRR